MWEALLGCLCLFQLLCFLKELASSRLSTKEVSSELYKNPHLSQMTERKKGTTAPHKGLNVSSQAKLNSTPGNSSPSEKLATKTWPAFELAAGKHSSHLDKQWDKLNKKPPKTGKEGIHLAKVSPALLGMLASPSLELQLLSGWGK